MLQGLPEMSTLAGRPFNPLREVNNLDQRGERYGRVKDGGGDMTARIDTTLRPQ